MTWKSAAAHSTLFASYWESRAEKLEEVQAWEVFHVALPKRTERCNPLKNQGRSWREVEEIDYEALPDPFEYTDLSHLDWLCKDLADGSIELHEKLYRDTDLVRVFEHLAARKAQQLAERVASHLALIKSIEQGD